MLLINSNKNDSYFLFLKLEQFCFPNNHTAGSSIFHLRIEKSTLALSLTLSS